MGKFDKDSLGNRQKRYEMANTTYLMPKESMILRIDGRAFHTFTKGMEKPFDSVIGNTMKKTMYALCTDIQNCVFGYTQSDEITLVLILADRVSSQEYLAGKVQKITSLSASKATRYFNEYFIKEDITQNYKDRYFMAEFDCRVFNIPAWDVINNIIWRQQDAVRNSIEAVGHANFSARELHKKNTSAIMDMLLLKKGINWNDFSSCEKRGACCYRIDEKEEITYFDPFTQEMVRKLVSRRKWMIDENMPILTQSREWFFQMTGLSEGD